MFSQLLLAPLAPLRGVAWITERLIDVAEGQLVEEEQQQIRIQLSELEAALERGEVSPDHYQTREEELLDRLFDLRSASPKETQ